MDNGEGINEKILIIRDVRKTKRGDAVKVAIKFNLIEIKILNDRI